MLKYLVYVSIHEPRFFQIFWDTADTWFLTHNHMFYTGYPNDDIMYIIAHIYIYIIIYIIYNGASNMDIMWMSCW